MEAEEFRRAAHQLIDYIIDYQENIRDRKVTPSVKPGYLVGQVPSRAPDTAEPWDQVMPDIDRVIMPGMLHTQSPQCHAYYPVTTSYPSILADILSGALNAVGVSWATSPALTELEVVMMDWLGKMLQLPEEFLFCSGKGGGGNIQGSACESTLITMLAASAKKKRELMSGDHGLTEAGIVPRLVAFTSAQAHCSVARAGLLAGLRVRTLTADPQNNSMSGATVEVAIKDEMAAGNIPFYVAATLGTTSSCAFDDVRGIGEVCNRLGVWLHIDAAYAGPAFVCPEFRHMLNGVELANSFNTNPHKMMLVALDCSALWVRRSADLTGAFLVEAKYLTAIRSQMPSFRHWAIQLTRRFRALKLWFVLRLYGVQGIQEHIRQQVRLAREFEELVRTDPRFEIPCPPALGVVCFRVKHETYGNALTDALLRRINAARRIHMVPAMVNGGGVYVIRFVVCARNTTSEDIQLAWREVLRHADPLLSDASTIIMERRYWNQLKAATHLGLFKQTNMALFTRWNSCDPEISSGEVDYEQVLRGAAPPAI